MPSKSIQNHLNQFMEIIVPELDEYDIIIFIDELKQNISKEAWQKAFGDTKNG